MCEPVRPETVRRSEDRFLLFCAVLTLVGLLFFPRLQLSNGAKLRLEDVCFFFMLVPLFFAVYVKRLPLYPETVLPLGYFLYGFAVSFIRAVIAREASFLYFLIFWAKEFQYYVFFLAFYFFLLKGKIRAIALSLIMLIALNAIVGTYKIASGTKDYYGIGALFFEDSSSLSGQVYFSSMLFSCFLLYFGLVREKFVRYWLIVTAAVSFLACLATGSKSSSFGILIFIFSFWLLNDLVRKVGSAKKMILFLKWAGLIILFVVFTQLLYNVFEGRFLGINLGRLHDPVSSTMRRYRDDIIPKFEKVRGSLDLVFGAGYLAGQNRSDRINFTSAFDSQYGRNLLVLGITGSLVWAAMLGWFAWLLRIDRRINVFYWALLVSYLAMGVGLESFAMSKSGPTFWIITGMLLAMGRRLRLQRRDSERETA